MSPEGGSESKILRAEAEKQAAILKAEAEKQAAILHAEATRTALIQEAEGSAEAIKLIIEAKPDSAYLTLQGFEALKSLADGQATKIIVPSEIQNIAGLMTSITETVKTNEKLLEEPKKTKK